MISKRQGAAALGAVMVALWAGVSVARAEPDGPVEVAPGSSSTPLVSAPLPRTTRPRNEVRPLDEVERERRAEARVAEVRREEQEAADAAAVVETELTSAPAPADPYYDEVSEAGRRATGVYLPAVFIRNAGIEGVLSLVRNGHLDSVVIDLKDGAGRVTYQTGVEILEPQVIDYLGDVSAVVHALREAGVYTIARIVCFADPQLPERHPERAIMHVRRDEPWVSWGTGGTWLDPYNRDNHQMVIDLANDAEGFGFDEIQLDYVRFPVDDGTEYARYPAEDGTERAQLILEMLRRLDTELQIPLGVDVFGLAAYREGDPSGLGQDLAAWVEHVEVFSPMLYINAMRAWQVDAPDRSRRLIETGVSRLRERLGPRPVIRPYLQAFARGAGHEGFNPRFIARQIVGARRGDADGFLFWHPGARYGMLRAAMTGAARGLSPFPLRELPADASAPGEPELASPETTPPAQASAPTSQGDAEGQAAGQAAAPSEPADAEGPLARLQH